MKKFFVFLAAAMLLASCNDNTSTSDSISDAPSASNSAEISASAPSVSEEPSLSPSVSEAPSVPPSASVEPTPEVPDLAAAIEALGDAFVIHYTNTNGNKDSMIYCTGKSVFTQNDSSKTEVTMDMDEWWVETTENPGQLSQCTWATYGEQVWYLTYEVKDSYSEVASNASSLDASLFTFDSENNLFNYSESKNIQGVVEMLAGLYMKNDFANLDYSNVAIKLSEDNSIVDTITVTAKEALGNKNDVTIEMTFSEYTALPFGLSDAEPIEAM